MPVRANSDNRIAGHNYEDVMHRAIRLTAETRPHPNPRVGAVVISADGSILSEHAHQAAGRAHAETLALRDAGSAARGATLVVTLEPCNHFGRTSPCTDEIIDAGVARVVVGAIDPDERVSGSGIERLRSAGVEIITGIAEEAVIAADPGYFHHRRTGRPRVLVKLAATLDGQVAAADGTSQWITGIDARRDVHRLRSASDAVVVGAGTLMADDPALTVRLDGYAGPQPRPVLIAGTRSLPENRRVYSREPIVYAPGAADVAPPVELVEVPGDHGVDLQGALKDLGTRGILDVLVEGGPTLAGSFAEANLVDEYVLYLAGKLALGAGRPMFDRTFVTLADARPVAITDISPVGADVRVRAVPLEEG